MLSSSLATRTLRLTSVCHRITPLCSRATQSHRIRINICTKHKSYLCRYRIHTIYHDSSRDRPFISSRDHAFSHPRYSKHVRNPCTDKEDRRRMVGGNGRRRRRMDGWTIRRWTTGRMDDWKTGHWTTDDWTAPPLNLVYPSFHSLLLPSRSNPCWTVFDRLYPCRIADLHC